MAIRTYDVWTPHGVTLTFEAHDVIVQGGCLRVVGRDGGDVAAFSPLKWDGFVLRGAPVEIQYPPTVGSDIALDL